jgi:hypothetical protein
MSSLEGKWKKWFLSTFPPFASKHVSCDHKCKKSQWE